MDKHLQQLAPKYFNTLFIRVFVENVPWLVERLGIKVLPCVMSFIDGQSKDRYVYSSYQYSSRRHHCLCRIIGFEDLGNSDQFETATLEWKLLNSGAVIHSCRSLSVKLKFLPYRCHQKGRHIRTFSHVWSKTICTTAHTRTARRRFGLRFG